MHMVAVNSRMASSGLCCSLFIHPSLPFPPRSNAEARERRSFACAFVFWYRPCRDVALLSVLCFFLVILGIRLFDARRSFCSLYPFPFFCFGVWNFCKSHFICFPSVLFRFLLASFYSFLASGLTSCCSCFIFLLLANFSSHLLVV